MMRVGGWPGHARRWLTRTWRYGAAWQLRLFWLLEAFITVRSTRAAGAGYPVSVGLDLLIDAFIAWRVWDGGHIMRGWLLITNSVGYLTAVLSVAREWNPWVVPALAIPLVSLVVLNSPAIRDRVARAHGRPPPRPLVLVPIRPPAWILPWGMLGGVAVTLLFLAQMGYAPLPGCGIPGTPASLLPERCIGLWQGYPLRFLVADQGEARVVTSHLLMNWAQWSLLCCSALYAIWWLAKPARIIRPATGSPPSGD